MRTRSAGDVTSLPSSPSNRQSSVTGTSSSQIYRSLSEQPVTDSSLEPLTRQCAPFFLSLHAAWG